MSHGHTLERFLRERVLDLTGPFAEPLRVLIDLHLGTCEPGHPCSTCRVPSPCPDVRLLASAWADHPDYPKE